MSRQIKFRTPTKCQNGHFRWMYLEINTGDSKMSFADKPCKCDTHGIDNGFEPIGGDLEFTNLRDKNQKEVYEGDIVRWELRAGETRDSIVLWSEYLSGFILGEDKDSKDGYTLVSTREVSIIGDIYQNPELLK